MEGSNYSHRIDMVLWKVHFGNIIGTKNYAPINFNTTFFAVLVNDHKVIMESFIIVH